MSRATITRSATFFDARYLADLTTDAGTVWALVRKTLAHLRVPLPDDAAA